MDRFDEQVSTAVVVVGSGVAGLTTALSMTDLDVLLVTKTRLGDGATSWAQGGIAAPLSPDDSPVRHADDTIAVGGGLNDPVAVRAMVGGAARSVARLGERGARFDTRSDGELALGHEAGHSVRRIVHSHGDATGTELIRALIAATRRAAQVRLMERVFVVDLVVDGGVVRGLTARGADGRRILVRAGAIVLATGGIGRIFSNTTNPVEVTGDGLAMAHRAGATISDVEFVQFHPTALATGTDPMPLLTEAIRGEGAVLVDDEGHRFMTAVHGDAELAPRDVIARAIWTRVSSGRKVFLDAREAVGAAFPTRFPTVFEICAAAGLDPRRDPIPTQPAAHYHMGGIAVDLTGRTSIPGLWAVGEVSRSGVHGANRLASNSLVEALVFGESVGADITAAALAPPNRLSAPDPGVDVDIDAQTIAELRSAMWDHAGLVRSGEGLAAMRVDLARLSRELPPQPTEARNMLEVATLVVTAADRRTESRGAHYRTDFPDTDPRWSRSLVFAKGNNEPTEHPG